MNPIVQPFFDPATWTWTYVVHAGADRYAVGDGIEAIGLRMLIDTLAQRV